MTINLDAAESAPTEIVSMDTPCSWLEGIPEEEESSAKNSVTYGLLSKRPNMGRESSGSGGQPMCHWWMSPKSTFKKVKTL